MEAPASTLLSLSRDPERLVTAKPSRHSPPCGGSGITLDPSTGGRKRSALGTDDRQEGGTPGRKHARVWYHVKPFLGTASNRRAICTPDSENHVPLPPARELPSHRLGDPSCGPTRLPAKPPGASRMPLEGLEAFLMALVRVSGYTGLTTGAQSFLPGSRRSRSAGYFPGRRTRASARVQPPGRLGFPAQDSRRPGAPARITTLPFLGDSGPTAVNRPPSRPGLPPD
jgi:hypothetical protein